MMNCFFMFVNYSLGLLVRFAGKFTIKNGITKFFNVLIFCLEEKEEGWGNVGLRARFSFIAIYVFKGVCKITMQTLHSNHTLR